MHLSELTKYFQQTMNNPQNSKQVFLLQFYRHLKYNYTLLIQKENNSGGTKCELKEVWPQRKLMT